MLIRGAFNTLIWQILFCLDKKAAAETNRDPLDFIFWEDFFRTFLLDFITLLSCFFLLVLCVY